LIHTIFLVFNLLGEKPTPSISLRKWQQQLHIQRAGTHHVERS